MTDPDYTRMLNYLKGGRLRTYPKIHCIANRMRIEQTLISLRSSLNSMKESGRNPLRAPNVNGISDASSEDNDNEMIISKERLFSR